MKRASTKAGLFVLLAIQATAAFATLYDRGGGLIYDDILNVTWLQDATYSRTLDTGADGRLTWANASEWVAELTYYDSVRKVVWSDWRLPHVLPINGVALKRDYGWNGTSEVGYDITSPGNELPHLYYVSLGNFASGDIQPIQNVGPFLNMPTSWRWGDWFWTETQYPYTATLSLYYFDSISGMQNVSDATNAHFAWALRDGDVAAVPEPTGPLMLTTGLIHLACFGLKRLAKRGQRGRILALIRTGGLSTTAPSAT